MVGIIARLGLLFAFVGLCLALESADSVSYPKDVCSRIGKRYPGTVFRPGNETYQYENESEWCFAS